MIHATFLVPLLVTATSQLFTNAIELNSETCDADCLDNAIAAADWKDSEVEVATDLTNYTVPNGLSMSRIIYTTEDLNGKILPTSAYIVWPYSSLFSETKGNCSKSKGLPMAAWAHGTSGVLSNCAPSSYRSLQYHFMAPFQLALQGMVVVAPDYAGLGVSKLPSGEEIKHPWLSGPSQANDIANAIIAARSVFPELLDSEGPFVTIGHSQGGGAAWAFAERQVGQPIDGYRGTVALAPPTRTSDVLASGLADPSLPYAPIVLSAQPKLIGAVTALYPEYNYTGLTPVAADRWFNVYEPLNVCLPADSFAFAGLTLDQYAEEGWLEDGTVVEYFKRAESGRKEFKGPLLVVGGAGDQTVPVDSIDSAVEDTCQLMEAEGWKESLEYVRYAQSNHFPVIQASQLKWLAWIKERLNGAPVANSGCSKRDFEGIRHEVTQDSIGPNFLVSWEPAEKGWRYVL